MGRHEDRGSLPEEAEEMPHRLNEGTKASKLCGLFPCRAIGLHMVWIRHGKGSVQPSRKRRLGGQSMLATALQPDSAGKRR